MSPSRLLLFLALPLLLTGCVTVTQNDDSSSGPEPAARTISDGVETWDLTGDPSEEALGIEEADMAADYRSDEPRRIVLQLAEDRALELRAPLLSFTRSPSGDSGRFTVGLRGATVEPEELADQLRDIVAQLGVEPEGVDAFLSEVRQAPGDQTERVRYSSATATIGDLEIGVQANVAPIAGAGRFIIGGVWR